MSGALIETVASTQSRGPNSQKPTSLLLTLDLLSLWRTLLSAKFRAGFCSYQLEASRLSTHNLDHADGAAKHSAFDADGLPEGSALTWKKESSALTKKALH